MQRIINYQYLPVYAKFCDGCNRELDYVGAEESAKVEFDFGYLSDNRDGQHGTFVFCQTCGLLRSHYAGAALRYQQIKQRS